MRKIIDSLDDWHIIIPDEVNKIPHGCTLCELVLACCDNYDENIVKLYFPSKGVVAKAILDRDNVTGKLNNYAISAKALVPKANPSLNPADYGEKSNVYMEGYDLDYIDAIEEIEGIEFSELTNQVACQIVEDYCDYNEYTVLDVFSDIDKCIIYPTRKDYKKYMYVDGIASYHDLLSLVNQFPLVVSKEENGVYFLDKSHRRSEGECDERILYVKFNCVDLMGDFYFNTMYYKVYHDKKDKNKITKHLLDAEDIPVIFNTIDLALLFEDSLPFKSPTAKVQTFGGLTLAESIVKSIFNCDKRNRRNGYIDYKSSVRFSYKHGIIISSIGFVCCDCKKGTTDFILTPTVNDEWCYDGEIKQAAFKYMNITDVLDSLSKTFYSDNISLYTSFTPFKGNIVLTGTMDTNHLEKALFWMNYNTDMVVNYISEKSVSLLIYSSSLEDYCNVVFYLENKKVIRAVNYYGSLVTHEEILNAAEGDYQRIASKMDIDYFGYISASFINYIVEKYIDYFKYQ